MKNRFRRNSIFCDSLNWFVMTDKCNSSKYILIETEIKIFWFDLTKYEVAYTYLFDISKLSNES